MEIFDTEMDTGIENSRLVAGIGLWCLCLPLQEILP